MRTRNCKVKEVVDQERVSLVTGGGQGIGEAICLAMARRGIKVAVNDINSSGADRVARDIERNDGIALGFQADISSEAEVKWMVQKVIERFGRIDYLVNNAGISDQLVPVVEQDTGKWQRLMDIHLRGTYLCCREAAKNMMKNTSGRIINISSIAGVNAFPMRTAYGPAKSGIIMLTKVLAIEWASVGITVNCVAPGFIRTEMVDNFIREGKMNEEEICNRIPLRRLGTTEEISEVVLFLCSPAASYITGQTIIVDGGWVAYGYI